MAIHITHDVALGYLGYNPEVVLEVGVERDFYVKAIGWPDDNQRGGVEPFVTIGIMKAIQEVVDTDQALQDYARVRLCEEEPHWAEALAA